MKFDFWNAPITTVQPTPKAKLILKSNLIWDNTNRKEFNAFLKSSLGERFLSQIYEHLSISQASACIPSPHDPRERIASVHGKQQLLNFIQILAMQGPPPQEEFTQEQLDEALNDRINGKSYNKFAVL